MFTSILSTATGSLTVANALVCILAALVLGLVIAFSYIRSGTHSKNLAVTLVILPVLIQIVIMMVNGNLGTGLAVLGAFSLVRFRSVPGSSKEICFIFFAMAVGLATGMGYITYAILTTVIISLVFFILSKTGIGERQPLERSLKVTIPENLDYTGIFDDLFEQFTKKAELQKVKTTNLGSMFELHYAIVLKDILKEKEFIDAIRCRNGNLNIVCSRHQAHEDEL